MSTSTFDKTTFADRLTMRLLEQSQNALSPFAAPPGEPAGPAEVVVVKRPLHRWRMQIYRDDLGLIAGVEMEPISQITHQLPQE